MAKHQPARREIRPGDVFHQIGDFEVRVIDQGQRAVDDLAQVMRRNVGRHADRNALRAINQQVREPRWQNHWFLEFVRVVRLKVDRVFVEVFEQFLSDLCHPHFGITHRGGVIAVHRTEVTLTIREHDGHRKVLRHADHRIVDRGVAVRVEFTHDITDETRRFLVGLVIVVTALAHPEQDATVNRFQAIAQIRDRPRDDNAHRIIEERGLHFFFDRDTRAVESWPLWRGVRWGIFGWVLLVAQKESPWPFSGLNFSPFL